MIHSSVLIVLTDVEEGHRSTHNGYYSTDLLKKKHRSTLTLYLYINV